MNYDLGNILLEYDPEPGARAGAKTSYICYGFGQKFWLLAAPAPAPQHWQKGPNPVSDPKSFAVIRLL